jgi:hypothetical protein
MTLKIMPQHISVVVYTMIVNGTSAISYSIAGSCWLDVPFSAVRHLRQLRVADISPEDVPDKVTIGARSSRPLFR